MYESLRLWHSAIYGRSIKEFNPENTRDDIFDGLISTLLKKSNEPKIKNTFVGRQKEAVAIHELNLSIEAITIYLVWLMKKNKLFGDTRVNVSL